MTAHWFVVISVLLKPLKLCLVDVTVQVLEFTLFSVRSIQMHC